MLNFIPENLSPTFDYTNLIGIGHPQRLLEVAHLPTHQTNVAWRLRMHEDTGDFPDSVKHFGTYK